MRGEAKRILYNIIVVISQYFLFSRLFEFFKDLFCFVLVRFLFLLILRLPWDGVVAILFDKVIFVVTYCHCRLCCQPMMCVGRVMLNYHVIFKHVRTACFVGIVCNVERFL